MPTPPERKVEALLPVPMLDLVSLCLRVKQVSKLSPSRACLGDALQTGRGLLFLAGFAQCDWGTECLVLSWKTSTLLSSDFRDPSRLSDVPGRGFLRLNIHPNFYDFRDPSEVFCCTRCIEVGF